MTKLEKLRADWDADWDAADADAAYDAAYDAALDADIAYNARAAYDAAHTAQLKKQKEKANVWFRKNLKLPMMLLVLLMKLLNGLGIVARGNG
jgi:hypothetical protein